MAKANKITKITLSGPAACDWMIKNSYQCTKDHKILIEGCCFCLVHARAEVRAMRRALAKAERALDKYMASK